MTDREEIVAGMIEADRLIIKSKRINRALLITVLLIGMFLAGWNWPTPADAATRIRGEVDVCVMKSDVPKSWTKGLEKKANKAFSQRVDVHRIAEDDFEGCEVVVWTGGRVALDYITGEKAPNPRYHVYTGEYAMAQAEINVGRVTPKSKRPATLVKALREAGVR